MWATGLAVAPKFVPPALLVFDWFSWYLLPVLILGAVSCLYLNRGAIGGILAALYVPIGYVVATGVSLGICAELFGGCK
ncbi:hypothetical protein [Microvirga puerhi]|uniref:Uncharacterized protein n=1 Tax=Microvirga puerhi TaxID=2876078 RepID=A0ABS7VSP4_9HYPH|nr:hypothetical protein [Microvirga puerhi]MBZ6078219.1 hypothetical protein [Microvirga puerhi]